MAQTRGVPAKMMESVDEVNEAQKDVLARKIFSHFGNDLTGKTIAVWGLAFKPKTDDVREAPALVMIDALLAAGATIRVHDPVALENVRESYGEKLIYCDRPYGCLEQADALAIATDRVRRSQPLRPPTHGQLGLHLLRNRPRRGADRSCRRRLSVEVRPNAFSQAN